MRAVGDWRRPWWFKAQCGVPSACLRASARQPDQPAASTREDKALFSVLHVYCLYRKIAVHCCTCSRCISSSDKCILFLNEPFVQYLLKMWLIKGKSDDMYRAMWEQVGATPSDRLCWPMWEQAGAP